MRKLLYLLASLFILLSCDKQVGYNIKVSRLDGFEDSVALYVYESLTNKVRKINEGVIKSNTELNLVGANDTIEHLAYLKLKNDSSIYYFVLDNIPIEISVLNGSVKFIEGSSINKKIYNRIYDIGELKRTEDSLRNAYNKLVSDTLLTSLIESELLNDYKSIKDSLQTVLMEVANDSIGFQQYIILRHCGYLINQDSLQNIKNKADYIK